METDRYRLKGIIHTRGSAEALTASSQRGHWEASADPRAWISSFNRYRSGPIVSICSRPCPGASKVQQGQKNQLGVAQVVSRGQHTSRNRGVATSSGTGPSVSKWKPTVCRGQNPRQYVSILITYGNRSVGIKGNDPYARVG